MIKLLPFILIPILLLAGLGYWRFQAANNLTTPQTQASQTEDPIEVPKTLPKQSYEDRIKDLEKLTTKLADELNKLKSPVPQASSATDSKLNSLDASVTELKVKVAALEKTTPATNKQATTYIPLGGVGGPWGDRGWYATTYEISLNSDNYPNYTGMTLEVIFRLAQKSGTASVRLHNVTDNVGYSEVSTASDSFSLQTSSSFKIATGAKTYKLQVKSSEGIDLYIQSARIKVNF